MEWVKIHYLSTLNLIGICRWDILLLVLYWESFSHLADCLTRTREPPEPSLFLSLGSVQAEMERGGGAVLYSFCVGCLATPTENQILFSFCCWSGRIFLFLIIAVSNVGKELFSLKIKM